MILVVSITIIARPLRGRGPVHGAGRERLDVRPLDSLILTIICIIIITINITVIMIVIIIRITIIHNR